MKFIIRGLLNNILLEGDCDKFVAFIEVNKKKLSEADLREADLSGASLNGADLREADLSWVNLRKADLRGADLNRANVSWADLRGADFRGASLNGADFRGADFRGADLSGASLNGAYLTGANLSNADLSGASLDNSIGLVKIMGVEIGNYYWKRFDDGLINNGYQFHVGLNKIGIDEIFASDERKVCSSPGFHFASRSWCALFYDKRQLEAKIRIPGGAKINEPWATNGKASADMIEIVQVFDVKTGRDVTEEYRK